MPYVASEARNNVMMRKKMLCAVLMGLGLSMGWVALTSAFPADDTVTKNGEYTVVNTTVIGKNIRGYNGTTPVKIFVKKHKVVKVEALKNRETPNIFSKAEAVLRRFEGTSVKQARTMNVDAVTGATYSSTALIKNVKEGLKKVK